MVGEVEVANLEVWKAVEVKKEEDRVGLVVEEEF